MSAKSPLRESRMATQFLRRGDHHRVKGADGENFPKQGDLVSVAAQCLGDLCRDALVAQEPQAHAGTASKSAKSRA